MQDENRQIGIHNRLIKEKGGGKHGKGLKKYRGPEKVFKHIPLLVFKGHGIDAEQYRDYILLTRLYTYAEEVMARNPGKRVWVIEDNAPAHVKAAKLCAEERERRGIMKVDWTPNSPDLHWIESLWDPLKDDVQPYWREIKGASKASKDKAREVLEQEWNSAANVRRNEQVVARWPAKLKLCHSLKGSNKFRG